MIELVKVRAVIQVAAGGTVVSREITETPVCALTRDDLLSVLKFGSAYYKPREQEVADHEQITAAGC